MGEIELFKSSQDVQLFFKCINLRRKIIRCTNLVKVQKFFWKAYCANRHAKYLHIEIIYTRMITENKEECQMFVTGRTIWTLSPTYPEQILLKTFKQRSAVLCNSTSQSSWSHVTGLPQQSTDCLMRIALLPPCNNNLLFQPQVLLPIDALTSQLKSNFSLRGVRQNRLEDLLFLSYLGVCWLPLTFLPISVLTFSLVEAASFPVSLLWERESWRRSRAVCVS